MAAKKRAIEARVGHTQGLDDIAKEIGKAVNRYGAMRRTKHGVMESLSKASKTKKSDDWNIMGDSYKSLRRAEKVSKKFDKNMKKGAK
jgi:hypothetical protein